MSHASHIQSLGDNAFSLLSFRQSEKMWGKGRGLGMGKSEGT